MLLKKCEALTNEMEDKELPALPTNVLERWTNLVAERGEDGARETMRERGRNGGKTSRGKRAFTETQYTVLEAEYAENRYPERDAVQEIADKADLTKQQVYQWFVNKRRRDNRRKCR